MASKPYSALTRSLSNRSSSISPAVLPEFQVRNDPWVEQADGIGRDRITETRIKFLGHGGTAHHLAALDHFYAQPGPREVSRASEAVVARADNDNVGFCHGRFKKC